MNWSLVVGAVVSFMCVTIAYRLGRRGRLLDFRFDVLQKCTLVYRRAVHALAQVFDTSERDAEEAQHKDYPERAEGFRRRLEDLDAAMAECFSVGDVVGRLFSEDTKGQWDVVIKDLTRSRQLEVEHDHQTPPDAEAFARFLDLAARECGVRRRRRR